MHSKQLRAPMFVPAASAVSVDITLLKDPMTTPVSSEMRSFSPSSSADHDTCTSSVQSCSAIFTPNQAQFVVLPSCPDIWPDQEHDQPLPNWITHHRSSATRFKPDLIECEDGTIFGADVGARQRAFSYRPRYCTLFSYRTPRVEGRTDAYQTVLLVARHHQRRRKMDKIMRTLPKSKDSCPHENAT